jgi:hypothetical protein
VSSAAADSALVGYTERSCLRKRRYWSQVDALVMAARCVARGHVGPLATYRCRNCDGWHLTRQAGDGASF